MILEKKHNNQHVVRQESPEELTKSDETLNNSTYNDLHLGGTHKQALHQRKTKPQCSTFTHRFKSTSRPHLDLVALWDSLETTWLFTVLPFLRQKFPLFGSYPWVFIWQNRQFSATIWSPKLSILLHHLSVLFLYMSPHSSCRSISLLHI